MNLRTMYWRLRTAVAGLRATRWFGIEAGTLVFRCNVCGRRQSVHVGELSRENTSCGACGSTVRMRAVVDALSRGLFGRSLTLDDFPRDKSIKGFGLSDWEPYAQKLAERLDYTNTFYHQEPFFDITNVDVEMLGRLDFLISSDVFEHVVAPALTPFENARRVLKPGGLLVLTVPYTLDVATIEHFPGAVDVVLEQRPDGGYLARAIDSSGAETVSHHPVFHGGPGSTLEMRVYSLRAILGHLATAGFTEITVLDDDCFEFGIYWKKRWSLPILARASH